MNHSSHSVNAEKVEALLSGDKDRLRVLVYEYVRRCRERGATADEACLALDMGHNSIAPRLTELKSAKLVELYDAKGRGRRKTRQGCRAGVVVAAEFALPSDADRLFPDDAPLRHLDLG